MCYHQLMSSRKDGVPIPDLHSSPNYAELSKKYPFLGKIYDIANQAHKVGKIVPISEETKDHYATLNSSDVITSGYSLVFRGSLQSASISLSVNTPPTDNIAIKDTVANINVNNLGQICFLDITREYWSQIMGQESFFPVDTLLLDPETDKHYVINIPTNIDTVDPQILDFVTKVVDLAYQDFFHPDSKEYQPKLLS